MDETYKNEGRYPDTEELNDFQRKQALAQLLTVELALVAQTMATLPATTAESGSARGRTVDAEMKAMIDDVHAAKGTTAAGHIAQVGEALAEIKDRLGKGEKLSDGKQEQILRDALRQPVSGARLTQEAADLTAAQYLG